MIDTTKLTAAREKIAADVSLVTKARADIDAMLLSRTPEEWETEIRRQELEWDLRTHRYHAEQEARRWFRNRLLKMVTPALIAGCHFVAWFLRTFVLGPLERQAQK